MLLPEIEQTRLWVEKVVVGLNLCPFAKPVVDHGRLHYQVSEARTAKALFKDFTDALWDLHDHDITERETTLLIAPWTMHDFLDFNDFIGVCEEAIVDLALEGEFQVAYFHPQFQFAETAIDAIENYTNRSPYPIVHLLREASIDRAVAQMPNTDSIYETNIRTLKKLGLAGLQELGVA
ncbi:MAG: DUF1415 domain-containing protein [Thiotrichales bacterium]|jgi:hypothetical protein|nr:DUF1415 domain-containing protein [Pseudomonadota bacterium]MCI4412026.1 DUF1415 domain-containing protein [Thiotrichales bacterium]